MTADEKLAVIAGNLRTAERMRADADAFAGGAALELAALAGDANGAELSELARLVMPSEDREMLARLCLCCRKYRESPLPAPFQPESAEEPNTVTIPEIARLGDALRIMEAHGFGLNVKYGDSFASCAEDVKYGHSRYTLMPMRDPSEGRLNSFERLREKHGLKIHCAVNVPSEEGESFVYQLCALGFPDCSERPPSRLSFDSDVASSPSEYLDGARLLGAELVSVELESTASGMSHISAVLATGGMDKTEFSALLMYLGIGADYTINGCYAEI